MSFQFIRDRAGKWPIRLMCWVLEVSASGYYAWCNRPESGLRPLWWTGSGYGFDGGPGVLILELLRAEIAEC